MEEKALTTIKRRTSKGEVKTSLLVSEEEFNKIVSEYSEGRRIERKETPVSERVEDAKMAAFPKTELKTENFNGVDTEGFEKAVLILKYWSEMVLREMQKKKNFRIEINYDAEALKTDFYIYTPIEDESNDTMQEQ